MNWPAIGWHVASFVLGYCIGYCLATWVRIAMVEERIRKQEDMD